MGPTSLLSFFFTFLTLFHGFTAQQWPNECQLDQLNALEPSQIIKSEGGRIEAWDHHAPQLRCSGFAFERFVIEPQGLYLPTFLNAGKLTFVVHGAFPLANKSSIHILNYTVLPDFLYVFFYSYSFLFHERSNFYILHF